MSAADFNTSIIVKGTQEECLKVLKVLRYYTNERQKQYDESSDCWYLLGDFELPEEVLKSFWKSGTMKLDLGGPYGVWNGPLFDEVDLFEKIADAVPTCYFCGRISGWDAGGDQSIGAEFKDGKLHQEFKREDLEDEGDGSWDSIYDPNTHDHSSVSSLENNYAKVSITLIDLSGQNHELTLFSQDPEWPISFKCTPFEILAADRIEKLYGLLQESNERYGGYTAAEADEVNKEISSFMDSMKDVCPDGKVAKIELTKEIYYKEPLWFGFIRDELKKIARKVKTCSQKKKQETVGEFQGFLESYEPFMPFSSYAGWPNFCGKAWSAEFDWSGVANTLEELADFIVSKEQPSDYAVEKVVVDYIARTADLSSVYMPKFEMPTKISQNLMLNQWIKDQVFVLTGFSDAVEDKYKTVIEQSGGIVKNSTVLKTNYLVYNPNYDHETTKLKRAKELIVQGKDIALLTEDEFIQKLES